MTTTQTFTKRQLIATIYPELQLELVPLEKTERSEYRKEAREEWTPADMPHAEWMRVLGKHN